MFGSRLNPIFHLNAKLLIQSRLHAYCLIWASKNIQPSSAYAPLRSDFYRLLIATSIDYRVQCYLFIKLVKVGLSPSKKVCFICFNESPIKMMKNAFYLILKAFFLHKILKFLYLLFGHMEKTT